MLVCQTSYQETNPVSPLVVRVYKMADLERRAEHRYLRGVSELLPKLCKLGVSEMRGGGSKRKKQQDCGT